MNLFVKRVDFGWVHVAIMKSFRRAGSSQYVTIFQRVMHDLFSTPNRD